MSKSNYIKPQKKGANKEEIRRQAMISALRSAGDIIHEKGRSGIANYIICSSNAAEILNGLINPDD